MESFSDVDSISYEICKYVINDIDSNNKKELTLESLKFTSKTIKYIFGKKINEDDSFKSYVISSIKNLISEGYLDVDGKSIKLTSKIINKFYNID